jgi:hypothetical protein
MEQQSLFTTPPPKEIKTEAKKITAKAAMAKAFLDGKVLNVKNCFTLFGITNCAREASRMIEIPFGVKLTRIHRTGESRYKQSVTWVDYRLDAFLERNKEGVKLMREYINQ